MCTTEGRGLQPDYAQPTVRYLNQNYIITGIINVCKITLELLKLKRAKKMLKPISRNTTTKESKGNKGKERGER